MGLPLYDGDSYFLADFLNFAHLARCAAAILALLFADIFRRLRLGLPPLYTPANALSAASIPDNCCATRSRSFFNCFTIPDKLANGVSFSAADCNRDGAPGSGSDLDAARTGYKGDLLMKNATSLGEAF
jgi:hypothetical protein